VSGKDKIVSLKKYKLKKKIAKNKRLYLLIVYSLTIALVVSASFYLIVTRYADMDVKAVTETKLFLYKY
jgi:hypothetical protein